MCSPPVATNLNKSETPPKERIRKNMLDYENQIFLDIQSEDGLVIIAKGLGIDKIFTNLIKIYCDPANLVLVMGTTNKEERYFLDELDAEKVKYLPKIITADSSVNDRHTLYMQGGVVFVTSRILVVDMLTDRVPIDLVTGILIYSAHRVEETKQEALILRLYRQKNKEGFIKAFSSNALAFTVGFLQLERALRDLFVPNLYLWPRFQATVKDTLDKHQPQVVELQLHLTPAMQAMQMSILDLINVCVKELKNCNPTLDTDEMTTENAISKAFDHLVRLQLEPVWNQLSAKSRQLVDDLKTVRQLLKYMTDYDCVTFYGMLENLRTDEAMRSSRWLLLPPADSLYHHAKLRVFGVEEKEKKTKKSDKNIKFQLEENPKWLALREVINEIMETMHDSPGCGVTETILVLVETDHTCEQVRKLLEYGGKTLLIEQFNKTLAGKANMNPLPLPETEKSLPVSDSFEDIDTLDGPFINVLSPKGSMNDPFSLLRVLYDRQPCYIIMYDINMTWIRRLEVYQADHTDLTVRTYVLTYTGSSDEQRYLTSLRREKEAFEFLIKEKANLVVTRNLDDHPGLSRDARPANQTVNPGNTRHGGQHAVKEVVTKTVVVDMREFRSELPCLLHKRNIEIVPVTLEIGDYILTPDICVERKSLSDLIQSLNSGRLYNQAQAMTRTYKRPILLIEFDHNKPFMLQNRCTLSSEISSTDYTSKLLLLTMHFPKLRLVWSPGPHATAEIFDQLKEGRPQPDVVQIAAVSITDNQDLKYNPAPFAVLSKLPGMNSKNIWYVINKVATLYDLTELSQESINSILGNAANAKDLWQALHTPLEQATSASSKQAQKKLPPNKKFRK